MPSLFFEKDYQLLHSHLKEQSFQKVLSEFCPVPSKALLSHLFIDCLVAEQKDNALFVLGMIPNGCRQSYWFKGLIAVISSGLFSMTAWVISKITNGISEFDFDSYCLFLAVSQQKDLRIIDLLCSHISELEIKKECLYYALRRAFREEKEKRLEFLQKGFCLFQHCPGRYEEKEGFFLLERFISLQHRIRHRAANKIYFWIFPKIYKNQKFVLEQAERSYSKFY